MPKTDEFTFVVPGEVRGKGRPKATSRSGFVRLYTDAKTVSYENLVRICALEAMKGRAPYAGPVAIEMLAYYAIPKSTPKKLIPDMVSGFKRPTKKPDLDNVLKAVLDGLNTVAFDDDAQVVQIDCQKFYGETPHLVVTVQEWA
jgi:Holliday junction resolvase RusA-like endonuclease